MVSSIYQKNLLKLFYSITSFYVISEFQYSRRGAENAEKKFRLNFLINLSTHLRFTKALV